MGMKMYKEYACTCYAYLLWHGQAKPFTAVQFAAGERDTILTSVELPWSNPLGDGCSIFLNTMVCISCVTTVRF